MMTSSTRPPAVNKPGFSAGGPDTLNQYQRPPSVYGDPHTMGQPMAQPRVAGPQWQVASGAPQPYTPQGMSMSAAGYQAAPGMQTQPQTMAGAPQNPMMPPSGGGPGEQQFSGQSMQPAMQNAFASGGMQQGGPIGSQNPTQMALQNLQGAMAPKPMTMAGPASTMPASVNPATRQALLPGILRGMNT